MYGNLAFATLQKMLCYKNGERYEILTGRDEMLIQCLAIGAVGFVGSQYNFAGKLYNAIIEAYQKGNIAEARELSMHALSLLDIQFEGGANTNVGKYIMNLIGIEIGGSRLPFLELTEMKKKDVRAGLKKWCQETDNAFITFK